MASSLVALVVGGGVSLGAVVVDPPLDREADWVLLQDEFATLPGQLMPGLGVVVCPPVADEQLAIRNGAIAIAAYLGQFMTPPKQPRNTRDASWQGSILRPLIGVCDEDLDDAVAWLHGLGQGTVDVVRLG